MAAATVAANAVARDEKLFSVFQIVKFNNDVCTTSDGNFGTCYTEAECKDAGGTDSGSCASGFGVCCAANLDSCSATSTEVRINNTYIRNAGYPSDIATGDTTCSTARARQTVLAGSTTKTYTIKKISSTVEQIRLDFVEFEIDAPEMGSCANSTLSITGVDMVTTKTLPTNLCGVLTGQHLYLSVKDLATDGSVTLSITLNALGTQKWNILVTQYESSQTEYLAPRGCLQYYRADAGVIMSMNGGGANPELLTDHMYTVCIAQVDDKCDVTLTASTFMLGGTAGSCTATDDKIVLGADTQCGATLGTANSLTWPYGGSYQMTVMTGSTNTAMNDGFSIGFMLLPC